jgi:hypothetical protein
VKVTFLIAGVQLSGTGALRHFLRQHPQLFMSVKKELHHFDNEELDWHAPDHCLYEASFAEASIHQLCGEATPIYTYWAPAAERIRNYNPKMKIIMLLRDPVGRAWSQWRMETTKRRETLAFSEAIREGRQRVLKQAENQGCHRVFSYVERGFYAGQVRRLLSLFPRSNLLFLTRAELETAHVGTLDKVTDFLGVPRFAAHPGAKLIHKYSGNLPARPPDQDIHHLRLLYETDLDETQELTGLHIPPEII